MIELTGCPECGAPAEVVDDWTDPASGVRTVATACANRHNLATHDGRSDFPLPAS